MENVVLRLSLPKEHWAELAALAEEQNMQPEDLAQAAVIDFLSRQKEDLDDTAARLSDERLDYFRRLV